MSAVHKRSATNKSLVLTDCFFSDALQICQVPHSHNISLSLRLLVAKKFSPDFVTRAIHTRCFVLGSSDSVLRASDGGLDHVDQFTRLQLCYICHN
jgi:hypothetical protein